MTLRPLDSPFIGVAAGWRAERENYQWPDFGNGQQILTAESLSVMTQRDIHLIRVIALNSEALPIELVASQEFQDGNPGSSIFSSIAQAFKFIGRQRKCHYIEGRPLDRSLFDLLASEHKEIRFDMCEVSLRD